MVLNIPDKFYGKYLYLHCSHLFTSAIIDVIKIYICILLFNELCGLKLNLNLLIIYWSKLIYRCMHIYQWQWAKI